MKLFYSLFLLILLSQSCVAQLSDNGGVNYITRTEGGYKSFIISNNKIYANTRSGNIVTWDLNTFDNSILKTGDTADGFTALGRDRKGQVYGGTLKGKIYEIEASTNTASLFMKCKYTIAAICFNARNEIILVIPDAVYDPVSKKHWHKFENHSGGIIVRKRILKLLKYTTKKYLRLPEHTFLDSKNRWWLYRNDGEWGGEVQIFDVNRRHVYNNKFDSINLNDLNPTSIFEDTYGNIYITSGIRGGEIIKIDSLRNATRIYYSEDYIVNDSARDIYSSSDYFAVKAGAYNKENNSIYFSTNKGLFRARLPIKDIITEKIVVQDDAPDKRTREALIIGLGKPIKQMEFTDDDKLVFLTENDGFGIYDKGKLTMLK